jgi:hypothetical protein
MKSATTLETMIFRIEEMLILDFHGEEAAKEMNDTIKLLKRFLPMEQRMIEQAFEDGVGEGMTDPERPLSGKEYYDIKFKQ